MAFSLFVEDVAMFVEVHVWVRKRQVKQKSVPILYQGADNKLRDADNKLKRSIDTWIKSKVRTSFVYDCNFCLCHVADIHKHIMIVVANCNFK